jgi:hypothetical protein
MNLAAFRKFSLFTPALALRIWKDIDKYGAPKGSKGLPVPDCLTDRAGIR